MILVSGGTGLIGSHLVSKLILQGKFPVLLYRNPDSQKQVLQTLSYYTNEATSLFTQIKWIKGDVTDIYSVLDAMEGIEEVYHCAAMISFNEKDLEALNLVNGVGTANMINAALEKGVKKFCYVSSIAVFQDFDTSKTIDESVFWKSSPENTAYAISKYNGEQEAWRGAEEGLNVVIVCPAVVLGSGNWGQSSGRLIEECYKGLSFYAEGSTGFVAVEDVADCMIQLMNNNKFNQRYILSGENKTFQEVINLFHVHFGRKIPTRKATKSLLKFAKAFENFVYFFEVNFSNFYSPKLFPRSQTIVLIRFNEYIL